MSLTLDLRSAPCSTEQLESADVALMRDALGQLRGADAQGCLQHIGKSGLGKKTRLPDPGRADRAVGAGGGRLLEVAHAPEPIAGRPHDAPTEGDARMGMMRRRPAELLAILPTEAVTIVLGGMSPHPSSESADAAVRPEMIPPATCPRPRAPAGSAATRRTSRRMAGHRTLCRHVLARPLAASRRRRGCRGSDRAAASN